MNKIIKNRDGLTNNDHWGTPNWLYNELNQEFNFDFDPCPLNASLVELIKTFSNEGATVLDMCCGSGATGEACKLTGRDFIGIDLDISVAKNRLLI